MARSPTARIFLPLLILSLVVLFTFGGTIKNDFVNWDDQKEISENPHFDPVTFESLAWNWKHTELSLYMPVTYMVWGGVAKVAHRDNPRAFHELNLALHLICTLLVFFLILQLWKRALPAMIGALVFAVHPLQVEPVAWASGMYTLLSTAFSIAAIIAYVAHATRVRTPSPGTPGEGGGEGDFERPTSLDFPNHPHPNPLPVYRERGRARFFWLATLFYILALLTKAASVSVPLAAFIIDVLILRRPIRKSIWALMLWIILAIPIVWIAKSFQDVSMITVPSIWTRPVVALDATGFYLRKIILPTRLIPDYGRNPAWVMRNGIPVMVSVATAMVALLLAYAARKNAAWITAGLGLLLAGIGPYLGLTTFDFQYVSTVADRYAYFSMLGIALLAAGAAIRSRLAMLGILVAVIIFIPISRGQVAKWTDTNTLFEYTLKVNPNSLVSHNVFGYLAAKRGDFKTAETDYKAALDVWHEDPTIHFNLGNLYRGQATKLRSDRALLLEDALEHYGLAVKYQPGNVDFRNGLAAALALSNRADLAYDQWQMVIALDPTYIDAHNNLADLLVRLGRFAEAREQYRTVLRIDPRNVHAADSLRGLPKE